ncbi:helix-turn-helix domain-containing protein [Actinocrispum wychmicini]|uniref:Regulatory LuxR family protein n=1 Tax=Actinocrispum wychmicini TaxID=1213861 RepID=A0A4R2IKG5_9PSEU|nr:helix-turn-helix transcriptional regulator [Actinocrispum wychmicini]TCO44786.1 regulatory LuxR family protein [Actinocrispum wychmicini]
MAVPTETEPAGALAETSDVDDFVIRTYEHIAANPGMALAGCAERLSARRTDVERAVDRLRHLGLVTGDRPVAVSPDTARMALLLPLEQIIRDRSRQLADCLRWSRPFEDAFDRARRGAGPAVTRLGLDETEALLTEAARRCTAELVMMQSCVAQEPPAARCARPLVLDTARRGVPVRLLYPHSGRGDTVTRSYLHEVTASSGQVRTCDDIFDRFVVFDSSTAFILTSGDEAGCAAAVIHEPIVIRFLLRIHDHVWQSATRFTLRQSGYGNALGVLKSSILDLLAAGLTDDVIARRVGMSERTLRRHIAAIMRDMSVGSRFQAGVAAASAGLLGSGTPAHDHF